MKILKHSQGGFTLIETIVGAAVFLLIALSVLQTYVVIIDAIRTSRSKVTATALANEQFEIARNLPYADVGIIGGLPSGKIPHIQTIVRDGQSFLVETTIRNIDDPFDGTIDGTPKDLSPSDYKLIELNIFCPTCKNPNPIQFDTYIAPQSLETASMNGALFVRVFSAVGQPIQGANVHIENNQAIPAITIDDTTNNEGLLQIVDAPPATEAYEIIVSKPGYSTESTYTTGAPANPNPSKPDATVALQQVTQISFAIDLLSNLNVSSLTDTCSSIPNIEFSLRGLKLIGTDPDILKYSESHITNSNGEKTISGLEWDNYGLIFNDASYNLAGIIPLLPLTLNPNTNQNLKLVVVPKNPKGLLVTVKDASTELPLSDATVRLEGTDYDTTFTTGRGFLRQTDWSGGSGQNDFIDQTRYFDSDGNIEISDPSGEILLEKTLDEYAPSGYLISSTFDTGSVSNFHQINWQPQDYPLETGDDSVSFQIATNNDKETWNFLGPDGTSNTFYTLTNQGINLLHNNDRYVRYKVFLKTADTNFTPIISDVSITFTSACVPPGQVLFSGLASGEYSLTIEKNGYQTFNDTINISSSWQQYEVILNP